jgi:hypothetical protein
MVVHDLDVLSTAIRPAKTNAPLVIDPNRMLAAPVPGQRLETIAWWTGEIAEFHCRLELTKLAKRRPGNIALENPWAASDPGKLSAVLPIYCQTSGSRVFMLGGGATTYHDLIHIE